MNSNTDINENLILTYIKLLSQFYSLYTLLQPWQSFPNVNELKTEDELTKQRAKIKITLNIILKTSIKQNDNEIKHIIQYNQRLLEDKTNNPLIKTHILNILVESAVTLNKLLTIKEKPKIEKIMVAYLQILIKNFYVTYHNSIYGLYEQIAINLSEINQSEFFFDYELAFIPISDNYCYFTMELLPRFKLEIKQLIFTFSEDLPMEFGLNKLDFNKFSHMQYLSEFLKEAQKFKKIKIDNKNNYNTYQLYKNAIKAHLLKTVGNDLVL